MEKALFVNKEVRSESVAAFDRLYFGAEFCQHRIPSLSSIKKVLHLARNQTLAVTFVTPYVTDAGLKILAGHFEYLARCTVPIEVVFNDWGVFSLLQRDFQNLKPILGRLLTKQRKDPRAFGIAVGRQRAVVRQLPTSDGEVLLIPKKIPKSLRQYFAGGMINAPAFHDFLFSVGLNRIEIDNTPWPMLLKVPRSLRVSVHLPYGYLSTTRLCDTFHGGKPGFCGSKCEDHFYFLRSASSPLGLFIKNNTVFYKTKILSSRELRRLGIDRVIFSSL